MLMAWCFSTRASVATVLTMHPCVSWCLGVRIWQTVDNKSIIIHNAGLEISNWMLLSVGQVDCENHLSECTIPLSEIYKGNVTNVKIRNTHSSVGQVLQVFHLSDCHFYSSQMIGWVKVRTLQCSCWGIILISSCQSVYLSICLVHSITYTILTAIISYLADGNSS